MLGRSRERFSPIRPVRRRIGWTIVADYGAVGLAQEGGKFQFLIHSAATPERATPEPATFVLMGTGILVVIGLALSRGAIRV